MPLRRLLLAAALAGGAAVPAGAAGSTGVTVATAAQRHALAAGAVRTRGIASSAASVPFACEADGRYALAMLRDPRARIVVHAVLLRRTAAGWRVYQAGRPRFWLRPSPPDPAGARHRAERALRTGCRPPGPYLVVLQGLTG